MEPDPDAPPEHIPDILRKPVGATPPPQGAAEVGDFRPGSPFTQWALARYLVGRALTESIGTSLLIVALVVFAVAAVAEWLLHSTFVAVLLVIVAVFVLLMRWVLLAIVRRLTAFSQYAPIEERINELVAETRGDVFRELRRVGLPSHMWTLPLLPVRLIRSKRRADTVERLRAFELARVVPKARIDETFLLLRQASTGGRSSSRP